MAEDRAVLVVDDRSDQGEAKAESGLVTAWVGPVVAFEDLLLFVRRNPDSRVGYLKFDDAGLAGSRDADPTAFAWGRVSNLIAAVDLKVHGDSPRLSFVLICESVADDG